MAPTDPPYGRVSQPAEVQARVQRYRELLVRQLHLKNTGFEREHGWVDEKGYPMEKKMWHIDPPGEGAPAAEKDAWNARVPAGYDSVMSQTQNRQRFYTTCDVLDYQPPKPVSDDTLKRTAVIVSPATEADDFYRAIARLDLAIANPARQMELFGWKTPPRGRSSGRAFDPRRDDAELAFERVKTTYWEQVCASALRHVKDLIDTADFHANRLLRLLYLAGETPPYVREQGPPWRPLAARGRDVNFSADVQTHIEQALLGFKFWVDDPFFVDGSFHDGDRRNVIKARRRKEAEEKTPRLNQHEIELLVLADIKADDYPEEMVTWSENHQFIFASAEYLAGQWLRDAVFRPGLALREEGQSGTRPGDMTGEQRMSHARPRLLRWLAQRMRLGFSEWNARPYYEQTLEPLFGLVDFCLDDEIRTRAEIVLDLLLFDLARFNVKGGFGPSSGRCYANLKMCGYDQGVGDLVELLFGTRDGIIVWSGGESAGAFAASRRYSVPEALVHIGRDRPRRLVDRSRVSVAFGEAEPYGVNYETLDDAMFWWSRGGYIAKQMVQCTARISRLHHLNKAGPFSKLLAPFGGILFAESSAQRLAGLAFPPSTLLMSQPSYEGIADQLAPLTEGMVLTRANVYTYRNRDALLSSVQNFRSTQLNPQAQVCQATLSPAASVWTTHPCRGASLSAATLGGVAGGLLLGPIGIGPGAIIGGFADDIELLEVDHDGPNWWTGSATLPRVVQHDGAAIIAYQPGEWMRRLFGDTTHAWFPKPAFDDGSVDQRAAGDCTVDAGNWTFGKLGDGYVGLFSARAVTWRTGGPWADKELIAKDGRNVFIIQIGNADEFGSYDRFKDKVAGARVHLNGLRLMTADFECSYDLPSPDGGRLELHVDDGVVRYNGARFSDDGFPRFETPYVKCGRVRWGQAHYTIAFGGHTLTHDFSELKTKPDDVAAVLRHVDARERDCNDDRFWVVSYRGAMRLLPENTIEACRHAVERDGAMGLLVDACLTSDGEVVLWHDWSPDGAGGLLRRLGLQDVGAFVPAGPAADDPLLKETIELTLGQLRLAYGYQERSAAPGTPRAAVTIPTLRELVAVAAHWADLRQLLVNVRLPAEHATAHGAAMAGRIVAALAGASGFAVTLVIEDEAVLTEMQAVVGAAASAVPIAFAWQTTTPGQVAHPADSNYPLSDYATALDVAIREHSAAAGAMRHKTAVASLSRTPEAPGAGSLDEYYKFVIHDAAEVEAFNLDHRANAGHQVDRLLARVSDSVPVMRTLIDVGVAGIVTDDVPALRGAVLGAGLF
jgi:glycerophosphoryl diester phosphodiesterase